VPLHTEEEEKALKSPTVQATFTPTFDLPPAKAEEKPFVLYKALYDYKGQDEDDLSFEAGDILRVFDEGKSGIP
jgi:hypothetical protein